MDDNNVIHITYAITVCNELEELTKLVDFLQNKIRDIDDIVIQYDNSNSSKDVTDYLQIIKTLHKNINVISFPLNKDFASFKNNLKNNCNGDYIFQIDADEIPSEYLIRYLPDILENNKVDVIFVPRINIVNGITDGDIFKWQWRKDERGWINFPDYQMRLIKNTPDVIWMNKVHEVITGYSTVSNFPADENFALIHIKDIDRQRKQNEFYNTI